MKSKIFTLIIILLISLSFFTVLPIKAQTYHTITLQSDGNGEMWYQNENTLVSGSTYTSITIQVLEGNTLSLRANANSGFMFLYYNFTYNGGNGTIPTQSISTTPIYNDFTIKAIFGSIAIWHQVTIYAQIGGSISWVGSDGTTGNLTSDINQYSTSIYFSEDTTVLFIATPLTGYDFSYMAITGGSNNGMIPYSPVNLTITSNFSIMAYFVESESDFYNVTIEDRTGGTLIFRIIGNNYNTVYGAGTYNLSRLTQIELIATPNDNYVFVGLLYYPYQIVGYYSNTSITDVLITSTATFYAQFQTNSIELVITEARTESTETNIVVNSGTLLHGTVHITKNTTQDSSGYWAMFTTPISTDSNIVNSNNSYTKIANGTFTNGYFDFTLTSENYTSNRYMGLSLAIGYEGTYTYTGVELVTTYAFVQFIELITGDILGFLEYSANPQLSTIRDIQVTYAYKFTFVPFGTEQFIVTPTPDPNNIFGNLNIPIYVYAIAVYVICIIGIFFCFWKLKNSNLPFAFSIGLVLGTVICNIANLLGIYTLPIDALVVVAIIAIIIFMRRS